MMLETRVESPSMNKVKGHGDVEYDSLIECGSHNMRSQMGPPFINRGVLLRTSTKHFYGLILDFVAIFPLWLSDNISTSLCLHLSLKEKHNKIWLHTSFALGSSR